MINNIIQLNQPGQMLTEEEKIKIELEEKYRFELHAQFNKKSKIDYIETIIKILQGIAIIAGIWATYTAYTTQLQARQQQEQERLNQERIQLEQTALEYRKFFYQKQFEYYAEATQAAAILATEKINSPDYIKARKAFYQLFWGRLSIVEDKFVEAKMVEFSSVLKGYEKGDQTLADIEQASLRLAHTASKYTIDVWVDSLDRKNYNR